MGNLNGGWVRVGVKVLGLGCRVLGVGSWV